MTSVAAPTDVFSEEVRDACAVVFIANVRRRIRSQRQEKLVEQLAHTLDELGNAGWSLSARQMWTDESDGPWAYATGFAHDTDIVGVFEAPTIAVALEGIDTLEDAGWSEMLTTEWILGPRDFAPVPSPGMSSHGAVWGFVALWQWNDAWQRASAADRRGYDADCDVAFADDIDAGISIAGRHRLDHVSAWHQLGVWESPTFAAVQTAMDEHERVADFKFTTSRHYIGRRARLVELLGAGNAR